MQPVAPMQSTTIVAPVVQRLGHHSSPAYCPSCKQQVELLSSKVHST